MDVPHLSGKTPLLITCPVCPPGRPATAENICPQCGTNLEPLRRVKGLPQQLEQQGWQLLEEGAGEEGTAYLAASVVLNPQAASSRVALGRVLLERGELEQAQVQAQAALTLDPENPEATTLQQSVQEAKNSSEATRKELERGLQEECRRHTTRRWKFYTLVSTSTGMLLVFFLSWAMLPQPQPGPAPQTLSLSSLSPSTLSTAAEVQDLLLPAFPGMRVKQVHNDLLLSGQVNTPKDLVELLRTIREMPQVKWDEVRVKHEYYFRYQVRPGDSLSALARRFYGQASRWVSIQEANRSTLKNAHLLQQGDLLFIPGR